MSCGRDHPDPVASNGLRRAFGRPLKKACESYPLKPANGYGACSLTRRSTSCLCCFSHSLPWGRAPFSAATNFNTELNTRAANEPTGAGDQTKCLVLGLAAKRASEIGHGVLRELGHSLTEIRTVFSKRGQHGTAVGDGLFFMRAWFQQGRATMKRLFAIATAIVALTAPAVAGNTSSNSSSNSSNGVHTRVDTVVTDDGRGRRIVERRVYRSREGSFRSRRLRHRDDD
jgi:hypothetical protein